MKKYLPGKFITKKGILLSALSIAFFFATAFRGYLYAQNAPLQLLQYYPSPSVFFRSSRTGPVPSLSPSSPFHPATGSPSASIHILIRTITLGSSPQTPLWHLDIVVSLVPDAIVCPASLALTVGSFAETVGDVCSGGTRAPGAVHLFLPVYGSGHLLTPHTNVPANAVLKEKKTQGKKSVTIILPAAPVWVALGDSYSSGHHQQTENRSCIYFFDENCTLMQNDPAFSWATRAVALLNKSQNVPIVWQMKPVILAVSGSTTTDIIASQVPAMSAELLSHQGSWNIVSMTGGANDISFSDPLVAFYLANLFTGLHPWAVTQADQCVQTDSLWQKLQQGSITGPILHNLQAVQAKARSADQGVRLVTVAYPYVTDIVNVCSADRQVQQAGTTVTLHGSKAVVDELDTLLMQLRTESIVVDLRQTFGTMPLGRLQLIEMYGYPHPNDQGQTAIASSPDLLPALLTQ